MVCSRSCRFNEEIVPLIQKDRAELYHLEGDMLVSMHLCITFKWEQEGNAETNYLGSSRAASPATCLDAELPLEADEGASWRADPNCVNSFFLPFL